MKTLGVRELKERISEVLHLVQAKGEIIEVTKEGQLFASFFKPLVILPS